MSLETMTKLSSTIVGAGGSSTITFTGIPQNYTDLRLTLSGRGTESNYYTNFTMTFNSSTTSDYTFIRGIGINSGVSSDGPFTSQTSIYIGEANAATSTASSFCHFDIHIGNYTEPQFKPVSIDKSQTNNSTSAYILGVTGAGWLNTSPINTITLSNTSGLFAQYSTATLYGVKSMRTAAGNSIKATGGAIAFDGTYVSHTFNSTDTFTPTTNLLVDYLVVAGGGGGGGSRVGDYLAGGGGAGGFRTLSGQSLLSGNTCVVTVGAGGAGASTERIAGTSGSDSTFLSITSAGGGGGSKSTQGSPTTSGTAGGSGGGGGYLGGGGAGNTPSTSPSQGNAGAVGNASSPYNGGGGGGAGAVGGTDGTGGAGSSNAYSNVATYYAGGGGGAGNTSATTGGIGGGGAGGSSSSGKGTNGTTNTGGGGGAAAAVSTTAGTGGSGIVIIRYKG